MKKRKVLLPFLVVAVALGLTFALIQLRQVPTPHEAPYLGPLVEVAALDRTSRRVVVRATGTVQPRYEVTLTPQVKGRVRELSPKMVVGGEFRKGEHLFAIEDDDYRLAIELARANLAQAELVLMQTENLAVLARREWQELNPNSGVKPDPLVVYEPQLKSARAQCDAARANVRQAELNLERTRMVAPFNCYVRSEQLEIGQVLNAGVPVATVAGTEQTEVVVPVPLDELAWLRVPRKGAMEKGTAALVSLDSGGTTYRWQGEITRALGEIDPRSRMARVVVTVAEPVPNENAGSNLLNELLPGMFVEVRLQGEELADVVAVPRGALRDMNSVWIVDEENRLHIRTVDVIRRERDEVLVGDGLAGGEKLVLTNLSAAAEGMLLRPRLREAGR